MELTAWERRLLRVLHDRAPREYRKTVRKAGNLLRKTVRRKTPRVSGELRKSYRVKMKAKDTVEVYTNKYYAKMVEEGHPTPDGEDFVPGKFYLKESTEEVEEQLEDLAKEFVRRMGKELGMDVSD